MLFLDTLLWLLGLFRRARDATPPLSAAFQLSTSISLPYYRPATSPFYPRFLVLLNLVDWEPVGLGLFLSFNFRAMAVNSSLTSITINLESATVPITGFPAQDGGTRTEHDQT